MLSFLSNSSSGILCSYSEALLTKEERHLCVDCSSVQQVRMYGDCMAPTCHHSMELAYCAQCVLLFVREIMPIEELLYSSVYTL